MSATSDRRQALVIGASRGLGLVLANELARRGWQVTATTRQDGGKLQADADASKGQLKVELSGTPGLQFLDRHGKRVAW